jgi:hypothetical protein
MTGDERVTYVQVQVPRAEQIARLNDGLRRTGQGGRIVITRGVQQLPDLGLKELLASLASYGEFDADNDPHGERDFGLIDHAGRELLWKIDYYDETLTWGSNDPADPAITTRVLTILLAEEY